MSRSHKKNPWCGDSKGKAKKRIANKVVRQWEKDNPDIILSPGAYKKLYESWEICDYGWYYPWEKYWEAQVKYWYRWGKDFGKPFPDKEEEFNNWKKTYKNK